MKAMWFRAFLLGCLTLLGGVAMADAADPTIDYASVVTAVSGQIQSVLTVVIPLAAVLFALRKGWRWAVSFLS